MSRVHSRFTEHRSARALRFVGALVAAAVPVCTVGCGAPAASHPPAGSRHAMVTVTAAGTVIKRMTDPRRGLVFEVESSPRAQKTFLSVSATVDVPQATLRAVRRHVLTGRCPVRGEPMLTFFGRWDSRARRFTTEIAPDNPSLAVASRAPWCELYVGRQTTPETATFPRRPFSRVAMR